MSKESAPSGAKGLKDSKDKVKDVNEEQASGIKGGVGVNASIAAPVVKQPGVPPPILPKP